MNHFAECNRRLSCVPMCVCVCVCVWYNVHSSFWTYKFCLHYKMHLYYRLKTVCMTNIYVFFKTGHENWYWDCVTSFQGLPFVLVCNKRQKYQLSFPLFVIGMAGKMSHHCCAKTIFYLATNCSSIQLMVCFYYILNSWADWNQGSNAPALSIFVCD